MNLLQIHEPGQTPLPHQHPAVGIDLGTTYSVIAAAEDSKVEVLRNTHGHALLPSAVYFGEKIEVGYPARARYEKGEIGVIVSAKRHMHEANIRLKAGEREVSPVEVSAEILKSLKAMAEQALGREVTQAVITVPAYFDDAARAATKDAAKLAGLEVLRLINEPTAAALAYGLDTGAEGIYAIYDLGGGTFDISLLKLEKGVFQVLATGGDIALGGDDFDQAIAAWVLSESGIDSATLTKEEVGILVALSQKAKHALTEEHTTNITYCNKTLALSREDFNTLILDYVERSLVVCKQALSDAKLSTADIKGVVMVGGSTRVPLVYEQVKSFFGKPPLIDVNPDEVVAVGAALQAEGLTRGSDNLLLDVIPLSLGLETMGGLTEKLVERNTPIPTSFSQEFTTWQDGQTGMKIHVVQGEREMVRDNRSLARFELMGIPPLPAGIARVKITFTVDADGLLTVSAEEKTTGVRQVVHVKPSYGLPPAEIEAMLLASMQHAREDITERLLAEARIEAERAVVELESAMKQGGALLEATEKSRITRQIKILQNAIAGSDRDYIDAELHQLAALAQPFAERRMNHAVGKALGGKHVDAVR